jgi:hypothetical protein
MSGAPWMDGVTVFSSRGLCFSLGAIRNSSLPAPYFFLIFFS